MPRSWHPLFKILLGLGTKTQITCKAQFDLASPCLTALISHNSSPYWVVFASLSMLHSLWHVFIWLTSTHPSGHLRCHCLRKALPLPQDWAKYPSYILSPGKQFSCILSCCCRLGSPESKRRIVVRSGKGWGVSVVKRKGECICFLWLPRRIITNMGGFILSQFSRPEVQKQGVSRAALPLKAPGENWLLFSASFWGLWTSLAVAAYVQSPPPLPSLCLSLLCASQEITVKAHPDNPLWSLHLQIPDLFR